MLAGEPRRAWSQEPGKAKHRRPADRDIPRDPHHISCTFPAFERPAPGALSVPQTPSPITSFRGAWPRTHTAYTRSFLVRRAAQAFCSVSRDRIRLGCDGACPADAGKQTRARPTNFSLEQCARRSRWPHVIDCFSETILPGRRSPSLLSLDVGLRLNRRRPTTPLRSPDGVRRPCLGEDWHARDSRTALRWTSRSRLNGCEQARHLPAVYLIAWSTYDFTATARQPTCPTDRAFNRKPCSS